MAVIGMLFLTALAMVLIYILAGFWFMYIGFADSPEATKIFTTLVVIAIVLSICYGWWVWIGSNVHVSFG